ncbi:ribulose-phosphate 3-epimerase [Microbacterium sp. gxy059]|uniref:ribulose-phosphate 3-epimerase n=1 Tax=Microbacterium sp. gxy059 TaxID=2957199 RepID=UPI003D9606F0
MRIGPSLLAADPLALREEVARVAEADFLHVDIFGGDFVAGATWGPHTLRALTAESALPVEAHLMAADLDWWVDAASDAGCDRVVFHVEATERPRDLADRIRERGSSPGIAVSPGTPIERLTALAGGVDLVLVMGVEPGRGGTGMLPGTADRVRRAASLVAREPREVVVGVDGSVSADNLADLVAAGARSAVVGTHLFAGRDPSARLSALREIAAAPSAP